MGRETINGAIENAPLELKKLSEDAHLPKERAVLSFFACQKVPAIKQKDINAPFKIRITSDIIRLQEREHGYYACSEKGLLLVITKAFFNSGTCITLKEHPKFSQRDKKSGAFIISV